MEWKSRAFSAGQFPPKLNFPDLGAQESQVYSFYRAFSPTGNSMPCRQMRRLLLLQLEAVTPQSLYLFFCVMRPRGCLVGQLGRRLGDHLLYLQAPAAVGHVVHPFFNQDSASTLAPPTRSRSAVYSNRSSAPWPIQASLRARRHFYQQALHLVECAGDWAPYPSDVFGVVLATGCVSSFPIQRLLQTAWINQFLVMPSQV